MIAVTRTRRRRSSRAAKPDNSPTPQEIRRMTAEIRKTWTHRERCRRGNLPGHYEIAPLPLQPRRKGFWGD
jgi:hypothetical protein